MLAATALAGAPGGPTLRFARGGSVVETPDLAAMQDLVEVRSVRVHEPYEGTDVTFEALPFAALLDAVYSRSWREDEGMLLLFTCSDGYQPTLPVQRVLQHDAWLAFDRRGPQGFSILKLESGSRKRVSLSPFYLIWENLDDDRVRVEGDYGWPYQVVGIDLVRAAERFPGMVVPEGAPAEARAGFADFRVHCSRCHRINGDGGTIGPDLNYPASPIQYRGRDWVRRWIDDPSRIAPNTRMPRLNPTEPDREAVIDRILAYLEAMSAVPRKPADAR